MEEREKRVSWCTRVLLIVMMSLVSATSHAAIKKELIEFWDDHEPTSLIDLDHSAFEQILQTYVVPDHPSGIARFNYAAVTEADIAKLDEYLNYLQFMEPRQLTIAEAKAFWLNLYNAATLKMVIETYLDGNIRKVKGRGLSERRWRRNVVTIAQQEMSLDDILNGVLRPMYDDPRIHYAVFLCTLGGPDMPTQVFNGDNNEALLDQLEAQYLSKPRAVRIEDGDLVLSEMFEDYDTDFADDKFGLIAYLKEHTPEPLSATLSPALPIRFEYDWSLNEL